MNKFCTLTDNGFNIDTTGRIGHCCIQTRNHQVNWNDVTDLNKWYKSSTWLNNIRNDLNAGIKNPACENCWKNESIDKGKDKWNFKYRAAISRPEEWTNRAWNGHKGRIEQFLRSNDAGKSPLDELVGEKITKDNTMFYVCGWQGTIDGTMDYLKTKNFVTEKNKREDGSYEVKFESYG